MVIATSDYGRDFAAIAGRGNVLGVQFHPEKSQAVGLAHGEELRPLRRRAATAEEDGVIVVPAIDIRGGKVVRLKQGRLQDETVYGSSPAETAARSGRRKGRSASTSWTWTRPSKARPQPDVVGEVIAAVKIAVEVGGGLRVLENALRYRDRGADRVIFGTAAVARPGVVQEAVRLLGEAVAVAIDARDGKVAVAGWNEVTTVDALELTAQVKAWGVRRVQYTDVVRDGSLVGPNLAGIEQMARASGLRITAAGGISNLDDLVRVAGLESAGRRRGGRGQGPLRRTLHPRRRRSRHARQAPDPLPGRGPGPRGQGREVRVPARRRRPRGVRGPLRRRGRRRAGVPRHHRVFGRAPHRAGHGAARGRHRVPALHGGRRSALGRGRRRAAAGRGRQGRGQHRGRLRSALLERLAQRFGSQAVVLAIDGAARRATGWEVYVHGGRTPTGRDAVAWAREGAERGAGEILLTSMDKDGTKDGFDVAFTRAVAARSTFPSSPRAGAARWTHMAEVLTEGEASAALAASIFHFGEVRIADAQGAARAAGVEVRR